MPTPRFIAPASSHVATSVDSASTPMNRCRSTTSEPMMTAPSAAPTATAAPRLRPARDGRRAGGTTAGRWSDDDAVTDAASHLEEFGFLVLDQVVDLVHVAVGGALQLLLGARHVVLAGVAVADDAVQLV